MALASTTVWECRTTGSDSNGGGFDPSLGGTDYTQQNAAQATGTATSVGTTVTATTGIFTAQMVGNIITDGTTWKQITAFTSSLIVTVDSAPSWTTATVNVGGALLSPALVAALSVLGNTRFLKYSASPFVISTTSNLVAGGILNITTSGSDTVADYWIGYDTTRTLLNTDTNRPTIQVASSGVTSVAVFKVTPGSTVANYLIRNIIIDGQSKSGIRAWDWNAQNGYGQFEGCSGINCTDSAFVLSFGGALFHRCFATGCSSLPAFSMTASCALYSCVAKANSVTGFSWTNCTAIAFIACASYLNTGGSSDGYACSAGNVGGKFFSCIANANGRDGFRFASGNARGPAVSYCVATGNAGWGYNNPGGSPIFSQACAGYSNTSGNESAITQSAGFVTLSGDPFVDAANGDFNLNNTAGAGADLRAVTYNLPG